MAARASVRASSYATALMRKSRVSGRRERNAASLRAARAQRRLAPGGASRGAVHRVGHAPRPATAAGPRGRADEVSVPGAWLPAECGPAPGTSRLARRWGFNPLKPARDSPHQALERFPPTRGICCCEPVATVFESRMRLASCRHLRRRGTQRHGGHRRPPRRPRRPRDPAAPWTVAKLAAGAGLSRAAFARRFSALIGQPPLGYLTWWRLTMAARLLRATQAPLRSIAAQVGYTAFANAFKRTHGLAPGAYRGRS